MEIRESILWIYLIAVNVLAFSAYGIDKFKAQRKLWRIQERVLLGLAVIGGSVGAYVGMKVFHHKTRKPQFYMGIPVVFMLQVLILLAFLKK